MLFSLLHHMRVCETEQLLSLRARTHIIIFCLLTQCTYLSVLCTCSSLIYE
ncbi:hypothetical protein RchiOBHm_Chr7g0229881 [Rosa chinensis]|uniref:Uncharacterized protein n=1 Tax=Rosa chinensis TaxID=74649 RepID=A0A2P6PF91_ROSCH|nr:hypothetical protein RchiOBHm_Chr7g0229881 [Rosa chinensis]